MTWSGFVSSCGRCLSSFVPVTLLAEKLNLSFLFYADTHVAMGDSTSKVISVSQRCPKITQAKLDECRVIS